MAANKKAPARAKAKEEYLLTTKLYCGDCGRLMAGESGKGNKKIVYHYYKCSGAKRRLGCKKKAIKKHWIEETVVKLTVSKVLTDEAIDRIADAVLVMQEQGDTMTPVLKQQLQQCEAEIRNVMKAIRQGIITETTKECLEDLETQRDSLKASILQLQLERRKFTKEEIVDWISKYSCYNLTNISIPSSMEYIGGSALPVYNWTEVEELWNNGVLAIDGWILRVRDDVEYIPDIMSYRGAAGGAYTDCNRLKTIVWDGYGCESAETVIVKHMTHTDRTHREGPLKMTLSLKNAVVAADIDLMEFYENYGVFFADVSGIRIYVENSEEAARYDDNFPGWNNDNKVIYGGRWTWANFYGREGMLISSTPRPNTQVIRRPVVADFTDGEYNYIFDGWDTDGDGMVNNLPATMIVDLHAHPVYTAQYNCQMYGHSYGEWIIITEPTEEQAGLKERVCVHCGHTEQERIEPVATTRLGDVNGDGRVNARDVRLLLRYVAGLADQTELNLTAADYNGDGRVNARDARAMLRFIAGLD